MKKFFSLSLSLVFAFGLLFPVKSTADGRSPFIQEIKKMFHCSGDKVIKDESKMQGAPIKGDKSSGLLEEFKGIFHSSSDMNKDMKTKKYPKKFDDALEKELKYPIK
ncbi:MAG: hypothetical protein JW800_04790 [Candidatus Omnitrophica bacterium]|nr:hypothetical protein [Candidatus Omnitrophota bacterium]